MIRSLRKRHRMMWLVLAVFLPLGILLSWWVKPSQDMLIGEAWEIGKIIPGKTVAEQHFEYGTIMVCIDQRHTFLRVIVQKPINRAGVAVYADSQPLSQPTRGVALGVVGSKGEHLFELDSTITRELSLHLLLYDPIKQEAIQQIKMY